MLEGNKLYSKTIAKGERLSGAVPDRAGKISCSISVFESVYIINAPLVQYCADQVAKAADYTVFISSFLKDCKSIF
jgi:hypothetical protein